MVIVLLCISTSLFAQKVPQASKAWPSNRFNVMLEPRTFEVVRIDAPYIFRMEFDYAVLDTNTAATFTEDSSSTIYGLSQGGWGVTSVNSGTAAVTNQQLGFLRITEGTANDDDVEVVTNDSSYHGGSKCLSFEAIVRMSNVDSNSFFVGFTNVNTTSVDTIAFFMDEDTSKSPGTVTDGFGFLFDTDATTDVIYGVSQRTDTLATRLSSSVTPVANTDYILRAEMNANGDVVYFVNGAKMGGTHDNAVSSTKGLYFYFGAINRGTVLTNTVDLKKAVIWSLR
jgi:hypothetical protein